MKLCNRIESTLFFATIPDPNLDRYADGIQQAFGHFQLRAAKKYATATDVSFSIGALTLTVAFSDTALRLDHYMKSKTPGTDFGLTNDVQRRLVAHKAAAVIRVTGPDGCAEDKTRLAVCYIATVQFIELTTPDFIHWAKSDFLYSFEQFFLQTGDPVPATGKSDVARRRSISATAKDRSGLPNLGLLASLESHKRSIDALRVDTLRRHVFSNSQIRLKRSNASIH